ncbi:MAG TPA: hypothetical protein VIL29_12660 [Pseudothermotoga sp.]
MNREEIFKSYKGEKGNTSKKVLRPAKEPEVFKLIRKAKQIIALRRLGG